MMQPGEEKVDVFTSKIARRSGTLVEYQRDGVGPWQHVGFFGRGRTMATCWIF